MAHSLTIPKWYDLHTHFRQGENVGLYISDHLQMGCAGALAMPNTKPPVSRVTGPKSDSAWSIEAYQTELLEAGAEAFDQLIIPLYLTAETTPSMIDEGAGTGLLRAAKYYPPHGTTNADYGIPMDAWVGSDVFNAMEANQIALCVHGEQHALHGAEYFDEKQTAESEFYTNIIPRVLEEHPNLRIICEHITTATAANFVAAAPDHIGATITPQHLLYTVGHLIQGLRYHLYCLPTVKFERDREELREALLFPGQSKFFAGTDSAPHTTKATECGCAAGCYTGGCAPQLYAMAFEEAGANLFTEEGRDAFIRFLCSNGPSFYGFPPTQETFDMVKTPSSCMKHETHDGPVVPLPAGMQLELTWSIT